MSEAFQKKPVAIFNADTQELIAIAEGRVVASKYIYHGKDNVQKHRQITTNINKKRTILKSTLNHRVAVRNATPEQISMLGNNSIVFTILTHPQ